VSFLVAAALGLVRCGSKVTALKFYDGGIHWNTPEGINHMPEARGKSDRLSASAHGALAASLAAALTVFAIQPSKAAEPGLVKIAVFDFELDDRSAGGGIIGPDAIDTENLKMSTEEARRLLSASGRYSIVDAGSVAGEVISAGGIQHCNACEGRLAKKLGADQSMVGIFTRVNRTEYTLQILVRDTQTGAVVSNNFTGLRMGANYAWPRGVKWLMDNRILSPSRAE
jgi:hypothetical protein